MPQGPDTPDLRALEEIVEGTAAETGEAFFDELVRHLARAIGTKCAWVTEWLAEGRRLRALSFWVGDRYFGDFEYPIAGTPCEAVIEECRFVHVPDRVVDLYRADDSLRSLGAVSYLGVPLLDTDGGILGHLGVLHDRPLAADPRTEAIFRIFAGRAAAELRRLRRDRDLREREGKLSGLFASALDAIVELDDELCITGVNPAGEKVFGHGAAELDGEPLARLLTPESVGRLVDLSKRLGEERRSVWIPEGIEGVSAGGATFPAEACCSARTRARTRSSSCSTRSPAA
jgi:PAS domain S-box-containing protein